MRPRAKYVLKELCSKVPSVDQGVSLENSLDYKVMKGLSEEAKEILTTIPCPVPTELQL